MKKLTIALLIVGIGGCTVGNNEIRTNDFIKNNPKPIIVRYGPKDGDYRPMTLQSSNGQILSIEYSQIFLPDTIK